MSASKVATLGILLAMLVSSGSCQVAGYVASVVAGSGDIEAVYTLPDKATVVFVDDPKSKLTTHDLAGRISSGVGYTLTDEELVSQVIPPQLVVNLKANTPDFDKWAIAKVGRQVGAEQVVYVLITRFELSQEGVLYRPTAEARVKVIDVASGLREFPDTPESGHAVIVQQQHRDMAGASALTDAVLARELAEELADRVAKLFYDHPMPEPGENLPG